jgi:hypothetical protein
MSRHHPACPLGAHVHAAGPALLHYDGYMVFVDTDTAILCIERLVADRIAELINAHGLADVPDSIPAEVIWGPPGPDERIVDLDLPEDPTT